MAFAGVICTLLGEAPRAAVVAAERPLRTDDREHSLV